MPGTWTTLKNPPSAGVGPMLLLTDGTVMVQGPGTSWYRFSPDAQGSYVDGIWSALAPSVLQAPGGTQIDFSPGAYASAVLKNGKVIFAGGEYNSKAAGQSTCALFDPAAGSAGQGQWHYLPSPVVSPGTFTIADAPCCVLPSGLFLLGSSDQDSIYPTGVYVASFDVNAWLAGTNPWTILQNNPGGNWEQTWTLLPDGSILAPSVFYPPTTYRFVPDANGNYSWVSAGDAGTAAQSLMNNQETGPNILLADGTVIAFGDNNLNALFSPGATPQWKAALSFPAVPGVGACNCGDAPAVLLPNGRVLVLAGPLLGGSDYSGPPALAFEYAPATGTAPASLTQVQAPPSAQTDQTVVSAMSYRYDKNGTAASGAANLYGYAVALDAARTVQSIELPADSDVVVLALALVGPGGASPVLVDLSTYYNVVGVTSRGRGTTTGGMDGFGNTYAAEALGSSASFMGATLTFGAPDQANAVSGVVIQLPAAVAGQYASLYILAAGVNGTRSLQAFTANYASGAPASSVLTLSDWSGGPPQTQDFRLLLLPTGEVMATVGTNDVEIYKPDVTTPVLSAVPVITDPPAVIAPGSRVKLSGLGFNGVSQANSYGDDASMATNYPLVRLRNTRTGAVAYCPTQDHSTMGVATGAAPVYTYFNVPEDLVFGSYQLFVVANGIPSQPVNVWVGSFVIGSVSQHWPPGTVTLAGSVTVTVTGTTVPSNSFEGMPVGSVTVEGGGIIILSNGTVVPVNPTGPIEDETMSILQAVWTLASQALAMPEGRVRAKVMRAAEELAGSLTRPGGAPPH